MNEDNGSQQEGTQEGQQTIEPSPAEQEARLQGWVPKEDFNGDEHKWVSAEEFLRRGPLIEKIERHSKELKDVKKALLALKAHHSKVQETAYAEALATLKAQKKAAYEEGNVDAIVDIDEKMAVVREEQKAAANAVTEQVSEITQEVNPVFASWVERNSWYERDAAMKAVADSIGPRLAAKGLSITEVLAEVEKTVKKEFPHKFQNPNRDKPGNVEGSSSSKSSKQDNFELAPEERQVMQTFVRQGIMTEKEYIAELKKVKGVN